MFSNRDLPDPKYQDLLYLSVEINKQIVRGALINTGAGINIMAVHTMKNFQISESSLIPSTITKSSYDQSRRSVLGKLVLPVTWVLLQCPQNPVSSALMPAAI